LTLRVCSAPRLHKTSGLLCGSHLYVAPLRFRLCQSPSLRWRTCERAFENSSLGLKSITYAIRKRGRFRERVTQEPITPPQDPQNWKISRESGLWSPERVVIVVVGGTYKPAVWPVLSKGQLRLGARTGPGRLSAPREIAVPHQQVRPSSCWQAVSACSLLRGCGSRTSRL